MTSAQPIAAIMMLLISFSLGVEYQIERQYGEIPRLKGGAALMSTYQYIVNALGFTECFDISTGCDHVYDNSTYVYDYRGVKKGEWKKVNSTNNPPPRAFSAYYSYAKADTAILIGGVNYPADPAKLFGLPLPVIDDMWEFFPNTLQWVRRNYLNGTGPGARTGSGIIILNDTIHLWGGLDRDYGVKNDYWTYNLLTNVWTKVQNDSTSTSHPPSRYIFSFQHRKRTTEFYIAFGNISPFPPTGRLHRDLWRFDYVTGIYTNISIPSNIRQRVHGAVGITNKAIVFALGNVDDDVNECKTDQISDGQNPVDETVVYHFSGPLAGTWELLFLNNRARIQRIAYTTITRFQNGNINDILFLNGGYTFNCANNTPFIGENTTYAVYTESMRTLELNDF